MPLPTYLAAFVAPRPASTLQHTRASPCLHFWFSTGSLPALPYVRLLPSLTVLRCSWILTARLPPTDTRTVTLRLITYHPVADTLPFTGLPFWFAFHTLFCYRFTLAFPFRFGLPLYPLVITLIVRLPSATRGMLHLRVAFAVLTALLQRPFAQPFAGMAHSTVMPANAHVNGAWFRCTRGLRTFSSAERATLYLLWLRVRTRFAHLRHFVCGYCTRAYAHAARVWLNAHLERELARFVVTDAGSRLHLSLCVYTVLRYAPRVRSPSPSPHARVLLDARSYALYFGSRFALTTLVTPTPPVYRYVYSPATWLAAFAFFTYRWHVLRLTLTFRFLRLPIPQLRFWFVVTVRSLLRFVAAYLAVTM